MALNHKLDLKTNRKILSLKDLESEIANMGGSDRLLKVVLTSGVFDLVHPGHIDYFEKAKSYGDILVVSVVDDKFVRKGPGRPIFNQELRLSWLAALEVVDYVVLNGGFAPWKVMKAIWPDIFVKGQPEKINWTRGLKRDFQTMHELGGRTVLIKEIMHSTEIFGEIRRLPLSIGR